MATIGQTERSRGLGVVGVGETIVGLHNSQALSLTHLQFTIYVNKKSSMGNTCNISPLM